VQIEFLKGGKQVGGPTTVNQLTSHPDITDAWSVIELGVKLIYEATTFQWGRVADDAVAFYKEALKDENQYAQATTTQTWLIGGGIAGVGDVDEAHVLFRAWSEDNLQGTATRVDHSNPDAQINSVGERHYDQNDNHFYESEWTIPVSKIPSTVAIFDFAAGDDGWWFDVGHSSILSVRLIRPFAYSAAWANNLRSRNLIKTDGPRKSKELNIVEGSLLKPKS
jgi:hypothetical protein